jgi:NAD(P)-dependent dehydrogenase (short-subunit alcohol dehydrogenase family)
MKTWFITGTSTGFGRSLTEKLLARGDRVAATLRRPEALDDLAIAHGDRLWRATLDVSDGAAVTRVLDDAFAALGRIDVIVSNAGYGILGSAEELSVAQIERQLDTNLLGSILVARAALPHLRAQGGGHLVQLSSMGGQMAFPLLSLYHATKWGIEGFYEGLAQEVAQHGIVTTLVEPGAARTDFAGRSMDAAPPLPAYAELREALFGDFSADGDPDKMADAIIGAGDAEQPPRRLLLGSDAYAMVSEALALRVAEAAAQRESASLTDYS